MGSSHKPGKSTAHKTQQGAKNECPSRRKDLVLKSGRHAHCHQSREAGAFLQPGLSHEEGTQRDFGFHGDGHHLARPNVLEPCSQILVQGETSSERGLKKKAERLV